MPRDLTVWRVIILTGNSWPRWVCKGVYVLCGTPEPNHADPNEALYRLTNAFSKKLENQTHAVALHFMHYSFYLIYQKLMRYTGDAGGWCRSCVKLGRNPATTRLTNFIEQVEVRAVIHF